MGWGGPPSYHSRACVFSRMLSTTQVTKWKLFCWTMLRSAVLGRLLILAVVCSRLVLCRRSCYTGVLRSRRWRNSWNSKPRTFSPRGLLTLGDFHSCSVLHVCVCVAQGGVICMCVCGGGCIWDHPSCATMMAETCVKGPTRALAVYQCVGSLLPMYMYNVLRTRGWDISN